MATSWTSPSDNSSSELPLIAGATFGGFVLVCGFVGVIFPFWRRRSRRKAFNLRQISNPKPFDDYAAYNGSSRTTMSDRSYTHPYRQAGNDQEATRPLLRGSPSFGTDQRRTASPTSIVRAPMPPPVRIFHSHFQSDSVSSVASSQYTLSPSLKVLSPPRLRGMAESCRGLQSTTPPPAISKRPTPLALSENMAKTTHFPETSYSTAASPISYDLGCFTSSSTSTAHVILRTESEAWPDSLLTCPPTPNPSTPSPIDPFMTHIRARSNQSTTSSLPIDPRSPSPPGLSYLSTYPPTAKPSPPAPAFVSNVSVPTASLSSTLPSVQTCSPPRRSRHPHLRLEASVPRTAVSLPRPPSANTIDSILSDYSKGTWEMLTPPPTLVIPPRVPDTPQTLLSALTPVAQRRLQAMPDVPISPVSPMTPMQPAQSASIISVVGTVVHREQRAGLATAKPRLVAISTLFRAGSTGSTSVKSGKSALSRTIAGPGHYEARVKRHRARARQAATGNVETALNQARWAPPVPIRPLVVRKISPSASPPVLGSSGMNVQMLALRDDPLQRTVMDPSTAAWRGITSANVPLRPKRSVTFDLPTETECIAPDIPSLVAPDTTALAASPPAEHPQRGKLPTFPIAPTYPSPAITTAKLKLELARRRVERPTVRTSFEPAPPAYTPLPTPVTLVARPLPVPGLLPARQITPSSPARGLPSSPAHALVMPTSPTLSGASSGALSSVSAVIGGINGLPALPGTGRRRALPSLPSNPAQEVGVHKLDP